MSGETADGVDVLLRDCHVVAGDLEASLDRLKEFLHPFVALLPRHAWINGDDAFGSIPWFRAALRERGERYLLEFPGSLWVCDAEDPLPTGANGRPKKARYLRASEWKDTVPPSDWQRIHVRDGLKGPLVVWATRARVRARVNRKRERTVEWLLVTRTEAETPEYRTRVMSLTLSSQRSVSLQDLRPRQELDACFEPARHWVME